MNTQKNLWLGVILSATVLGLAVVYILNSWLPQDTLDWALFAAVALIAIRSVVRIAGLAKQASENDKENKDR
ncbi:MAG: hypothetical protein J6U59_05415 [Alistipes sp.]|jgi:uncharacterized membrane protein YcjF (UPF0283 family)|nr:hypothetical protein [Alistipes sp.]